jgi:predicted O-methyltransferase YrrM
MCFFVIEEAETFSNCTMRVPRLGAHSHLLAEIDRRSDQLIDRAELVRESCGSDRRELQNRMPIENAHLSPERIEAAEPGLFRAFQDLQGYVFGAAHTAYDDIFIAGSAGLFPSGNRASHVQAVEYLRLARQPWIKTVCEVGFNWGGSSLLWLWTKPDLKVLAFDLMDKSYSWDALRWLQSTFPNRIEVIPGDSNRTLSNHNFDVPCDLILVDAEHSLNSELNNILLMLPHAANPNLLIVDDCSCAQPKIAATKAWDLVTQALLVRTIETWSITDIDFDIRVPHTNSPQKLRLQKEIRNENRNWCVGEVRMSIAAANL